MNKEQKTFNLTQAVSPYDIYCDGYGNLGASGNGYLLGVMMGIGKTKKKFYHQGSQLLDEINAFDLAEVSDAYIGQLNMSIVSSFCGPQGLIWGYDLALHSGLRKNPERKSFPSFVNNPYTNVQIPVYSIDPLIKATKELFGTVDNKKHILRPGAHVPFAGKNIKREGPHIIYSGLAIGIAADRERDACLLMEDIGEIPLDKAHLSIETYKDIICNKLAESVVQVGHNQGVTYSEIFVGVKAVHVARDEIACALVACPYFTLAKNCFFRSTDGSLDFARTIDCNMNEWIKRNNAK